jgi:hypothetical protein
VVFDSRTWAVERAIKKIKTYPIITVIYSKTCYLEDDNQSVKTVLVPTYINYRNSEIGNSDSDFSTGTPFFFSDIFPTEFSRIPKLEAEIPIPDPPGRGAVPAEFPTKS